jgi:hypothetical protein
VSLLVAITTCPRPAGASYLEQTLASLGDGDPLILCDLELRGARANTWRALNAASGYDRLLLLQDDVIASAGLRDFAATVAIPDDVGFVTGHDFGDDFTWQPPTPGLHKFPAHRFGGIGLCGAQCLIMPGEHAAWLAAQDPSAPPKPGPHGADYAIGWWTARSLRPNKLIAWPALVEHVGERSACWDDDRRAAGVGIPHAGRTFGQETRA